MGGEWEPCVLAHVPQFKYLGSMVEGGHRTNSEIEHRLALGRMALRRHHKFFRSGQASLHHKMQAYRMYGVSVVTQGFVGWHLSDSALRMLTHFDLTAQSSLSGWSREVMAGKRTFSLTTHIRTRRLEFLARTIALPPEALPRKMLIALHQHITHSTRNFNGTIFMDTPEPDHFGNIVALVGDSEKWAKWRKGRAWEGVETHTTNRPTRNRGPKGD